jgi:formate hydrogenlyase transcriptional activator
MGDLGVQTANSKDGAAKALEQDLVESGSTLSSCGATVTSMPGESSARAALADSRYRALLDVSSTIAQQPSLQAVLRSVRSVLSNISGVYSAGLYLLTDDGKALKVIALDRASEGTPIPIGTEIACTGVAAQVLQTREPAYFPDVAEVMLTFPSLAPFASRVRGRHCYLFPLATSRKEYGFIAFTSEQGREFGAEDVELMGALAGHVAVALENAVSIDAAAAYQRQLAEERDHLGLLLEINNHIVTKLEVDDLFQAVAESMRKHLGSDATTFWLLNQQSGCLERRFLDFPTGRGFLAKVVVSVASTMESEWWRLGKPQFYSPQEMSDFPRAIREAIKAESLLSRVSVPLVGANGPLGLMHMSSRKADAFSEADSDLLTQIGTQISLVLDNALAYGRLRASRDDLEDQRLYLESEISSEFNFEDIVGKSAALRKVLDQIAIVAATQSTVLLHGETGTGKELFARAIHNLSPRRERTFVRLNCAAIPSGLVESELFGHEKGAFTGALMQKRGRFELADRGTLFLDEIGDISLELQPKLLRALQEHEFERLGSTKTIHVDVRLIAATHRDLQSMIRNNQFREDLFYRLNVFPIEIPPLRERREDIPLLVHYFVLRHSRHMQKRVKSVPKQAMEALVNADWPGNIRQLENFIERCVIFTQGEELNVPYAELKKVSERSAASAAPRFEQAERQAIIDALIAASGRIAGKGGAAERLGLKRTTLQNKMHKLNIKR